MSSKEASIQLKLSKAKSLLAEATILMQHQFYTTVINRLYYACFHATRALLLTKDLVPKTHSGVVAQLHLHFVQDGSFDKEQAAFFSRLMQERIEDDYSDYMLPGADVKEFIEPAHAYVAYIEGLISKFNSTI
jgi:uncharacterized protein (UPF0332 family)